MEWAIFSVYSVIKTSSAGGSGVVAHHPSCRGHKERQREKKNEVPARKWQRRRAPLKRRSKHKIMKSEVEGNARRTDTCFLFLCLFFTRTHRLICLSFPPSFKHLSSSSPFVWYQHFWRYKKNCMGWWVGSWFQRYTEITVNVIYMLSVFSLIFCSALNFTTTRECPSDGTVPVTSGCWRPANVFCDAHEVVPLIYIGSRTHTHGPLQNCLKPIALLQ